MKRVSRHLIFMLITTIMISPPALQAGKIKCWTNAQGVKECGNVVPPEFAQQGHEERSTQGIIVKEVERAKTKEELAAEEEKRKAREEQERITREQAKRDRVLLDTFSNEDEIIMTRDGKVSLIDTEISITQRNLERVRKTLDDLRKRAARKERSGDPPGKKLRNNIKVAEDQISEYTRFIDTKRAEQKTLLRKYEADLNRFRELKGIRSGSGQGNTAPK